MTEQEVAVCARCSDQMLWTDFSRNRWAQWDDKTFCPNCYCHHRLEVAREKERSRIDRFWAAWSEVKFQIPDSDVKVMVEAFLRRHLGVKEE